MIKSTKYYLQIIEEEMSKVFGIDNKRLSTAVRTIRGRNQKAYEQGRISFDEACQVELWLRKIN